MHAAIIPMIYCRTCGSGLSSHVYRPDLVLYWHQPAFGRRICPMELQPLTIINGELVEYTGVQYEWPWRPVKLADIPLPEPTINDRSATDKVQ